VSSQNDAIAEGVQMHALATALFPICRSLTGDGVRQTLAELRKHLPLQIHEVPTGTQAFDWTVPPEWNVRDAFVADEQGNRILDFRRSNLHIVGYSTPVDRWMSLDELQANLHSLEDQPDAIPYITSYYKPRWGFCIAHRQRQVLRQGRYRAMIDSELKPGHLTYAECIIPGSSSKEVFLSTYICHPSMANNELSGPMVATAVAQWLQSAPRRYTYRLVFIPETIGAIVYLSRNLEALKRNVVAGFNLSCIGDERGYSFVQSRYANTLADRVAANILRSRHDGERKTYTFLDRGSDERQYCSPGAELPLVTLSRSKFSEYPEYHTSLDDLSFVTPRGLQGGIDYVRDCIRAIEANHVYRVTCIGEPQLGKRGLYPDLSTKQTGDVVRTMMDLIAYCDGLNDLVAISDRIGAPLAELYPIVARLVAAGLLEPADGTKD
jgi:aminopeptidase-like protein